MVEGKYRLIANLNNDSDTNTYEKIAFRDFQVILREQVNISNNDLDNDDDGLYDSDELNIFSLPETPVTEWLNSDVHIFNAFGELKIIAQIRMVMDYGWIGSWLEDSLDTNQMTLQWILMEMVLKLYIRLRSSIL